jgi:hypothetical protein
MNYKPLWNDGGCGDELTHPRHFQALGKPVLGDSSIIRLHLKSRKVQKRQATPVHSSNQLKSDRFPILDKIIAKSNLRFKNQ